MRKKIKDTKIEDKILKLLKEENRFLSIRETTNLLKEKYKINKSPQIIKRHLLSLKSKGKIIGKENGKTN